MIVSYRCREMLRDCLESLRDHPPKGGARIFVADNDSRDGTVELVRERFPEVALIPSAINLGFGRASNLAIRRGKSPYVLCLNPDTRIPDGALDELTALMDSRPEIGICGCRLELEDGTTDHAAKRSFPTLAGALGHFSGLGRRSGSPSWLGQYRAPEVDEGPVDAVNGAFMLIRRSALDVVGLFDEGYWMYVEDLDLCYRFKQAGYVTWYEPSVTVVHIKAGTSGKNRNLRLNYAFHYGMYRFYRAYEAGKRNPLVNALVYAGIGLKFTVAVLRSSFNRGRARLARRIA